MYKFILLISILSAILLLKQYKSITRNTKGQKTWLLCRMLILIIILVCVLIPQVELPSTKSIQVILIDNSYSMRLYKDEVENFLKQYISQHGKEKLEVYLFDENIQALDINAPVSVELKDFARGKYTDLNAAYDYLKSKCNEEQVVEITLITDGLVTETIPSINTIPSNFTITTVPFSGKQGTDISLDLIEVASVSTIDKNLVTSIKMVTSSTIYAEGTFVLFDKKGDLETFKVTFNKGIQDFILHCKLDVTNKHIQGRIIVNDDKVPYNNTCNLKTNEDFSYHYLVISSEEETHPCNKTLNTLLDTLNITYQYMRPEQLGDTTIKDISIDAFILNNCDGDSFTISNVKTLEKFIHDTGKGCFVIGGDHAFGLGGYSEYKLEEFMPVEDKLSGPQEKSNTALVVVLDTSGSMEDTSFGTKKITLAKSGLKAIVAQLSPYDEFGIIGFSDTYEWLQPLKKVEGLKTIEETFTSVGAKGGTLIKPSLVKAYEALKSTSDEKQRHILLITDGQGDQNGYDDLIGALKEHNITLSCIGIGEEPASEFLNNLSSQTKGTFYEVNDVRKLPQIMVRDVYKNAKETLQEGAFTVEQGGKLGTVTAYVATTAKPDAKVLLSLDSDDPLLVSHTYGIGKVTVLTSRLEKNWSGNTFEVFNDLLEHTITDLPLVTEDHLFSIQREMNRLNIFSSNENIQYLDLVFNGSVQAHYELPFLTSPSISYNSGNQHGIFQINAYNKNNDLIGSQQFEIPYSAEYQLNTEPSWINAPSAFNYSGMNIVTKNIKTHYIGWPIICLLFLKSIYYREK